MNVTAARRTGKHFPKAILVVTTDRMICIGKKREYYIVVRNL